MLSQRLSKTIDRSFIGRFVEKKARLWQELNPSKFYVENIRSFFGLSYPIAKRLCEIAVRMGYFTKRYEVLCPEHGVIAEFKKKEEVPEIIICEVCVLMEEDNPQHIVTENNILEYYKLVS